MEKRRFQRIPFKAVCVLGYCDISETGQVETLSLNGAMISFSDSLMVPEGELCSLAIFLVEEEAPLLTRVMVVYSTLFRVHVQFVSFEEVARLRLIKLMESLSPEPEKLRNELQLLGWEVDG